MIITIELVLSAAALVVAAACSPTRSKSSASG
jgi:hypothetical protein